MYAVFAGLLGVVLSATSPAPAPDSLPLAAVRFYRADHGHTRVAAFLEIPATLGRPGAAGSHCYEVTVRLADERGKTLQVQRWRTWRTRRALAGTDDATQPVEMVEFLVTAGRYRLEATVQDSASGREGRAALDFDGYPRAPLASDLLLSPAIRGRTPDDSLPHAGELRRGDALVTAAAVLRLAPDRTVAYYLLEAYPPQGSRASGTMAVRVRRADGPTVRRMAALPVELAPGGSVLRGKVDLAGLAPGRYELIVAVALGGESVERSAAFVMEAAAPAGSSSRN
jgi:hypothetical protein